MQIQPSPRLAVPESSGAAGCPWAQCPTLHADLRKWQPQRPISAPTTAAKLPVTAPRNCSSVSLSGGTCVGPIDESSGNSKFGLPKTFKKLTGVASGKLCTLRAKLRPPEELLNLVCLTPDTSSIDRVVMHIPQLYCRKFADVSKQKKQHDDRWFTGNHKQDKSPTHTTALVHFCESPRVH